LTRGIRARNERINGKRNAESLDFMEYVKRTPSTELVHQRHYAMDWQRIAIDRELGRRDRKEREGQSLCLRTASSNVGCSSGTEHSNSIPETFPMSKKNNG
jgi:hypothetical protein